MSTTITWPLLAIRFDGQTTTLSNPDAVRAFMSDIRSHNEHWGVKHVQQASPYGYWAIAPMVITSHWVVRDDFGAVITRELFDPATTLRSKWSARRCKQVRIAAAKGLPIPGTGCWKAGYKMNHTAKKNSGSGHRNRNRALAIYEAAEYAVPNKIGSRVIPYEGW